jgi:hypothetical protein
MHPIKLLGSFVETDEQDADLLLSFISYPGFTKYYPLDTSLPVYVCKNVRAMFSAVGYSFCGVDDERYRRFLEESHTELESLDDALPKCENFKFPEKEGEKMDVCSFCRQDAESCPLEKAYGPFYLFPYIAKKIIDPELKGSVYWCIAHPDERQRMERILNGTDNPIYDLVHELRYNPSMPVHLGAERRAAKEDFEQQKKRQRIGDEEEK